MGARLQIAPLPRRVLFGAWSLAGVVGVSLVAIKVLKLLGMSRGFPAAWIPVAIAPDLLFTLGIGLTWSLLLASTSGRLRSLTTVLVGACTWTILLFLIGEHGFFDATGSVLDVELVAYTWTNFGEIKAVLASETPLAAVLGVFVSLGVVVLPSLLTRVRPIRVWLDAELPVAAMQRSGKRGAIAFAVAFLMCLWGVGASLPSHLAPLESSPVISLVVGAMNSPEHEKGLPELDEEIPSDVRLVSEGSAPDLNVVLVVLESTRARSTTPYNAEMVTMPVLKRLADEGVLVEEAYTVVPHTSKALVGIHCGAFPRIRTPIEESEPGALPTPCLATLLRSHGYSTAFFQTAQEEYEGRAGLVENFGFETFIGKESLDGTGFDECSYFGYEDDAMFAPSMQWMERQKGPFFAAFLTLTPHHDYKVPRGFDSLPLSDDEELNGYLNTLRYVDRFLGKLHAGLDERGLLENTVFVIVGDHGEGFAEHGRRQHDNVIYEEGLRVPLVFSGAGLSDRPARVEGLHQTIDILPTLADILGMRLEGELPGRSVFEEGGHDAIYASCWYPNRCLAVRRGDYKFIHHYNRRGMEVFDLKSDPLERRNLLGTDAELDATARRETTGMLQWKARINRGHRAHDARRRALFIRESASPVSAPVDVTFGNFARLRGHDSGALHVRRGDSLDVDLHFEVLADPEKGWRLFTHVMGPRGMALNADHVPALGAHPVRDWRKGEFIRDVNRIRIPASFKPGRYALAVGFWRKSDQGEVGSRAEVRGPDERADPRRFAQVLEFEVLP